MAVEYIWIQSENGATMVARQPQHDSKGLFGDEGMTFNDVMQTINPLHHIPIVGSVYREITGETIKPGVRLLGGAIFGLGVGGLVSAAIANAVEETTGKDALGTAIAMARGKSIGDQVAEATKARETREQVAQVQYQEGGADPIDQAYLPKNRPTREAQLAALHPGRAGAEARSNLAAAGNPAAASVAAAAAPAAVAQTAAVAPDAAAAATGKPISIAALPELPTGGMGTNTGTGTGSGAPGSLPDLSAKPAGITGLTGSSRLPGAGSVTPAGAAMTAAQIQSDMVPKGAAASPMAAVTAGLPAAAQRAVTEESTARAVAAGATPARSGEFMPVPPRMNAVTPRMPVALNQPNVGTQPLALSTPERSRLDATRVTAAPAVEAAPAAPVPNQVPSSQVPDAMARALDKYDALMRSRRGGGGLDQSL